MAPGSTTITTVAHFECGDPCYAWLNHATVVRVGEQIEAGPVCRLYEIGRDALQAARRRGRRCCARDTLHPNMRLDACATAIAAYQGRRRIFPEPTRGKF